MEIEENYKEEENIQSEVEQESKIREKVKNNRKNFTIKEIREILNY